MTLLMNELTEVLIIKDGLMRGRENGKMSVNRKNVEGWVLLLLLRVPLMVCFLQETSASYVAMVEIDLHFSRNKNCPSLDPIGR